MCWALLPPVLLGLVSKSLCLKDVLFKMNMVCRAWRSVRKQVRVLGTSVKLQWPKLLELVSRQFCAEDIEDLRLVVYESESSIYQNQNQNQNQAIKFTRLASLDVSSINVSCISQTLLNIQCSARSQSLTKLSLHVETLPIHTEFTFSTHERVLSFLASLTQLSHLQHVSLDRFGCNQQALADIMNLRHLTRLHFARCIIDMTQLVAALNTSCVTDLRLDSCQGLYGPTFEDALTTLQRTIPKISFTPMNLLMVMHYEFFSRHGMGLEEFHLLGQPLWTEFGFGFYGMFSPHLLLSLTVFCSSQERDWISLGELHSLRVLVLGMPREPGSRVFPPFCCSLNGQHFSRHLVSLDSLIALALHCPDLRLTDIRLLVCHGLPRLQTLVVSPETDLDRKKGLNEFGGKPRLKFIYT